MTAKDSKQQKTISVDIALSNVNVADYDSVIFTGGKLEEFYVGGAAHDQAKRIIRETLAKDKVVGAICTGPEVLAQAGVLDGMKITRFCASCAYDKVKNMKVVRQAVAHSRGADGGDIITGRDSSQAGAFVEKIVKTMRSK